MSRLLQPYRVTLSSWDLWEIWLDATSPADAEAEARRIFERGGEDEFRHRDCGVDCVEADRGEEGAQ